MGRFYTSLTTRCVGKLLSLWNALIAEIDPISKDLLLNTVPFYYQRVIYRIFVKKKRNNRIIGILKWLLNHKHESIASKRFKTKKYHTISENIVHQAFILSLSYQVPTFFLLLPTNKRWWSHKERRKRRQVSVTYMYIPGDIYIKTMNRQH